MTNLVIDPRDAQREALGVTATADRPVTVTLTTSRLVRLAAGGFLWDGAPITAGLADHPVTFDVLPTDSTDIHADDRNTFEYVVTIYNAPEGVSWARASASKTFRGRLPGSLGLTVQVTDLVPAEPPGPLTPGQYAEIDARLDALEAGGGGGGGAVASVNSKTGVVVLNAADVGAAPVSHTHTSAQVSDATSTGKALLTAADAAAARAAIGAGTSNLALGSTGSTAAAGNHGHTSAAITDLTETVQDVVGAFLVAGSGVTVSYDDAANTFTINATGGGGGTTDPEIVRDVIGTALVAGSGVQITVNDAGDSITVASTAVLPTRTITAGSGLTGGGDLSANRTLAVDFTVVSAKAHSHWADDVVRGGGAPLAADVLGTGTPNGSKFLRDDRSWQAVTAAAVSDSTSTGRALLTAADAAAARTATGAAAASHSHGVTDFTATGTKDATTFLRGDNTWAVPAGGGGGGGSSFVPAWSPPSHSGGYYHVTGRNSGAASPYLDEMFLIPFNGLPGWTYTKIGANVTTACTSAGGVIRFAIYERDLSTHQPTNLIVDAGTVSSETPTGFKAATISWTCDRPVYLAMAAQVGTTSLQVSGSNNNSPWASSGLFTPGGDAHPYIRRYPTSGAAPSTITSTTWNAANHPIIFMA